ncbi:heavy-metal-associated domain-containing protein [Bizionia sediminis]|uniref:Heavy-metal-associated domain-containing protein n=1 Tax=Bizionia sediminis TaxID=1737064 RepID=A0ABW5KTZ9_9FLAO
MKTTLVIQNLKCGGCAHTISSKLNTVPGVENLIVDVETSQVSFNNTTPEVLVAVKQKLKALGYPEADAENSVLTKAKSYISCATGKIANHDA